LLNAGVPVFEAWRVASIASGSFRLRQSALIWIERAEERGLSPGELLPKEPVYPELFSGLYRTGEMSGSLDNSLRRLYAHYLEEGMRKMKLAADWGPKLLYFGIALWVAFRVVSFYSTMFGNYQKVLDQ